jgi:hypothetical protein
VRTPITQQAEFAALEEVRVPSLSGSTLPLSQLASLEFEKAPRSSSASTVNAR